MTKFLKLNISKDNNIFENIAYLPDVIALAEKYKKQLFDDYFFDDNKNFPKFILNLIEHVSPCFWLITRNDGDFIGFVFLDDWQGSKSRLHAASVTTCICKKYWGCFTKKAGKRFINYVFSKYKLKKIKAEVFSSNHYSVGLLKKLGFSKEADFLQETLLNGTPIGVSVYSIINNKRTSYESRN
ncbi:MAG: GNAT family protein [Sulfurospirillaceae bacterium]|nr:GNAT family protein [Sulfurospirillaceae bacterium]